MDINLGYGKEKVTLTVPDSNMQAVIEPNVVDMAIAGLDEVKRALGNPIGSPHLKDIVKQGEKICIVTSDITRPMPSKTVLPPLLDELHEAGCKDEDITIVFALGNHRRHTQEEMIQLVGEDVYTKIRCIDSDQDDIVDLGQTEYGTPVEIFREVAEAHRVICLGNIEYHYFAGYSGGAKAIMPGVSTANAIQANHKRMVEATSVTGNIDSNRVRQDIEQVINMQRIDFILNVVLNEKKEIVKAVAGHYISAHRVGCAFLDSLYLTPVKKRADIVVVSAGGFPKDINLYQAQKALDNSKHAVREGGVIILLAACGEGLGEEVFERWMTTADSPQVMIRQIEQKFELGGHKAAAIGMVQEWCNVYLVSEMNDEFVKSLFFSPYSSAQEALDEALQKLGDDANVIVMPFGGSTLPVVKEQT